MQPTTLPTRPYAVTDDTFVIPTIAAEPSGTYVAAHSMVIRGTEPVVIDTGCSLVREQWVEQAFSVVDPRDVRWVVLSHDDHDHIGNVHAVLDLCPNATLVASYAIVMRLAGDVELPLERMRWVNRRESLTIGDRELHFVRPPMFDSPSSRAIFDSRSRVVWGVDAFGVSLPGEVYELGDVPTAMYEESFAVLNQVNTPWLEWVDRDRFEAHLQETASLPIAAWASAHGPVLRGDQIADAFARTRALVGAPAVALPGQEALEFLRTVLMAPAA